MNKKGLFIVFEGIDGSGKSSISKCLFERLQLLRVPSIRTFEPFDISLKNSVEKLENNREILDRFINDRREHLKRYILPNLESGYIVICDRYVLSTIVYQRMLGYSRQELIDANKSFISADITFYLDVESSLLTDRLIKRDGISDYVRLRENISNWYKEYSDLVSIYNYGNYSDLKLGDVKRIYISKSINNDISDVVNVCLKDISKVRDIRPKYVGV